MLQFFYEVGALANPVDLGVMSCSVILGIVFGALPGLTATLAVALLSTVTFGLPVDIAMIALIGSYVGAIYGPSHASILLGIPGSAAGAATALDGYVLAQQGRAGEAISIATVSSAIGTIIGLLALLALSPVLIELSLQFTSAEFFLLALFGVLICGSLDRTGHACERLDCRRAWPSGGLHRDGDNSRLSPLHLRFDRACRGH